MVDNNRKLTKNEKRRLREKNSKNNHSTINVGEKRLDDIDDVIIDYVSPNIQFESIIDDNEIAEQFKQVFSKFNKAEELLNDKTTEEINEPSDETKTNEKNENSDEIIIPQISKKKKRLASRLSVAELKQLVNRPDVVEAHDVTANDSRLLVSLKATRNTVPVPRHWSAKRKYLQGKRGIEKPPFQLPEFIAETGIAKIRQAVIEQETLKKSKQKARDRVQPKMGKIDIDYQVLHDAFFKYQTKPNMTIHGDLYYEGKEFEVKVKDRKPGVISPELKEALGLLDNHPPPWLINMQRYGPPPSYPSLKIPGLNAPIPPNASFGYQTGGWGKPPVDEYGRPIYGDVFGSEQKIEDSHVDNSIDKNLKWGELVNVEVEEESEGEEEEEEIDNEQENKYRSKATDLSGIETPVTLDGMTSTTTGLETPEVIDLRKRAGLETPNSLYGTTKELYQVIQEKQTNLTGAGQFFNSDRAYALPNSNNEEVVNGEIDGPITDADSGTDGQSSKRKRKVDSDASLKRLKEFKF